MQSNKIHAYKLFANGDGVEEVDIVANQFMTFQHTIHSRFARVIHNLHHFGPIYFTISSSMCPSFYIGHNARNIDLFSITFDEPCTGEITVYIDVQEVKDIVTEEVPSIDIEYAQLLQDIDSVVDIDGTKSILKGILKYMQRKENANG